MHTFAEELVLSVQLAEHRLPSLIPHAQQTGMEPRHAAGTLQPWLDHATPRVCRRRRARRCHGQNSVPSARKRCCQRVLMPSGRGNARSRRSAASMVVTVPGSMAPARQATPKRAPRPPSGRCERHAPQTVIISKTPLRSGSPLRVLVELGTVGRCALAESCRTAARSNGDIGQSENPHFRFLAAPIKPSRPSWGGEFIQISRSYILAYK